jgi:hypothetical protein
MDRADLERIVRSVMREYGVRPDIRRIVAFAREWRIDLVDIDGRGKTLTVFDSTPQNMRRAIIAALELDVE